MFLRVCVKQNAVLLYIWVGLYDFRVGEIVVVYPQIHILYKYKSYIYWIFTRHKYSIVLHFKSKFVHMSIINGCVILSVQDAQEWDFK